MSDDEKRFDVVIFEYATGRTEAIIGTNLNEDRADRREFTGLMRCNSDYGTRSVLIGSDDWVENVKGFKK